jgi:phage-related protein
MPGNGIARVLFTIAEWQRLLPDGFIRKRQQTPDPDLSLARGRQKDVAS